MIERRYVVWWGRPLGKLENPDYTYYYKTREEAEREGERWLGQEYKVSRKGVIRCNYFTVEERYYSAEYCEQQFNHDGSQKIV